MISKKKEERVKNGTIIRISEPVIDVEGFYRAEKVICLDHFPFRFVPAVQRSLWK